jgi:hypothetical protein
MDKDEAIALALEALEYLMTNKTIHYTYRDKAEEAITAIKQALAAPVQEPVAWMHEWDDGERVPMLRKRDVDNSDIDSPKSVRPLVFGDTTPPAAQPAPVQPVAQAIIHAITEYGDARADQDANNAPTTSHERLADCIRLIRAAQGSTPPAAAVLEGRDWSLLEATQASLREHMAEIKRLKAAQPAVPDAMTSADIQEHIEYVAGWNECRAEMLKGMK